MDWRDVVSRRLRRLRARGRAVRAASQDPVPVARRRNLRGRSDRTFPRPARQFRERRIVGPSDRRVVGDDLSERRAAPAPHLRILPRARCAARFPLARHDDGHAAVDPALPRRGRLHCLRDEAIAAAERVMASPLEAEIAQRIAAQGSVSVAEYMALCLAHYYGPRDPLGRNGDFITAPEVSQMFGELIGLWMATVWQLMRAPSPVRIVELGPGRGTLMADALRAAKIVPGFREAISLHLVEISAVLQAKQRETLRDSGVSIAWHDRLDGAPDGPAIIVANEFFDTQPAHQAVKRADGWHERRIDIAEGRFVFSEAPETLPHFEHLPLNIGNAHHGAIFEWRDEDAARALGQRVAQGGAALVIDYGHAQSAAGETLQAVGAHAYADPLTRSGELDLTAHVDFEAP